MFVLFEKSNSRGDDSIRNYDCMGIAKNEQDAMAYRDENPEYRIYKYCPDKEIKQSKPDISDTKFELYEDMTDIKDSMQIDSETEICRLENDKNVVTIEVRGEVQVDWSPEGLDSGEDVGTYYSPSEFPEALQNLIAHNNQWMSDDRVYVSDNNWFELFIWEKTEDGLQCMRSEVVDCEKLIPERLHEMCGNALIDYLQDKDNLMNEEEDYMR